MPLNFEQQPKESDKAFAAFSLYLSLGPERSTAAVAKKLAKSAHLVRRWCARHDWPARVAAHAAQPEPLDRRPHQRLLDRPRAQAQIRAAPPFAVATLAQRLDQRPFDFDREARLVEVEIGQLETQRGRDRRLVCATFR